MPLVDCDIREIHTPTQLNSRRIIPSSVMCRPCSSLGLIAADSSLLFLLLLPLLYSYSLVVMMMTQIIRYIQIIDMDMRRGYIHFCTRRVSLFVIVVAPEIDWLRSFVVSLETLIINAMSGIQIQNFTLRIAWNGCTVVAGGLRSRCCII